MTARPPVTHSFDLRLERGLLRVYRLGSQRPIEMVAGKPGAETADQLRYLAEDVVTGYHTRRGILGTLDLEVDGQWMRVIETLPDGERAYLMTGQIVDSTATARTLWELAEAIVLVMKSQTSTT